MFDAATWGERAKALARAGLFLEAEAELRAALKEHPTHAVLGYALAILLLARGAYDEGWKLYENRLAMPGGPPLPRFSFPRWDGQAIRSLLVLPEQGFGDQIMFARFVREVSTSISVTLVTPPATARLFEGLGANVVIADGPLQVSRHDAWCHIGSLPRLVPTFPTAPYLTAAGTPRGIGLMLRGSGRFSSRDLPPRSANELQSLGRSLHPDDTRARDFQDTANIIANLDLVISIDTSVAHLSASLGKPTWLLLRHEPDWRWGRCGDQSVWYPSMRLFRQIKPGDWNDVIYRVKERLNGDEIQIHNI